MATRSDDGASKATVIVIDPDEEVQPLDEWLALTARSEPIDLGVAAADLLDEVRNSELD